MKLDTLLDMSNEDYHAGNGFYSSSQLKDALKSRQVFFNKYISKVEKQKQIEAFVVGNAAHTLLLEPELYSSEYAIFKGVKRGAKFEQFKKDNPGKVILGNMQESKIRSWVGAVQGNKLAAQFFQGGTAEKSIFSEINGLKLKARYDYMIPSKGLISDLKTTSGVLTEKSLRDKVYSFGYHVSAALYLDMFNKVYDGKLKEFYLVFVSKDTLEVKVVKLDDSILAEGRERYIHAIEEIKIITSKEYVCKEEIFVLRAHEKLEEW